jgi:hypothetical protein
MTMKHLFITFISLFLFTSISVDVVSQETKKDNPFAVGADIASRYVWRGTDFGASPSIQPGISYNYKGLSIGSWGAFTTNMPGVQELDLFIGYSFLNDMLSITFTDYFFPNEITGTDNYFEFDNDLTGHIFEVSLSFNGTEDLPLGILIGSNIFGADAKRLNDDGSIAGNQYSTYAELSYNFEYISLFAGLNLIEPDIDKGEAGFYADNMGFVNLGITISKEIKVTDSFSIPFSVSLINNPQTERMFLVAKMSF